MWCSRQDGLRPWSSFDLQGRTSSEVLSQMLALRLCQAFVAALRRAAPPDLKDGERAMPPSRQNCSLPLAPVATWPIMSYLIPLPRFESRFVLSSPASALSWTCPEWSGVAERLSTLLSVSVALTLLQPLGIGSASQPVRLTAVVRVNFLGESGNFPQRTRKMSLDKLCSNAFFISRKPSCGPRRCLNIYLPP